MEELLCTKVYKRIQTCINICCTVRLLIWLESEYSYNPAKKFLVFWKEGIEISLSVCLFVRLCLCVQSYLVHIFLMEEYWKFTQRLLMNLGCVIISTQVHLGKFIVTRWKSAQFVSGLYLSFKETFTQRLLMT